MTRNERILVWFLRVTGVIMLSALGAVVMPFGWMNSIHLQMSLGVLPDVTIVGYLTRSISALYALHGALLIFLSYDVRRYVPVLRFLAVTDAVFGGMMLGIDRAVGMPLFWMVSEGPSIVASGLFILWLTARKRFPYAPNTQPDSAV
jgi:hypothetical protein